MDFVLFAGGAAHGLVSAVETEFGKRTGAAIKGYFGAVGVYRDKFVGGDHADMLILSRVLIDQLVADGHIEAVDVYDIGAVSTAVAVRSGDTAPDVSNEAAVKAALEAATDIYLPDPVLSTAGIHFASVLKACSIDIEADPRLRAHPNGATAMAAMAAQKGGNPIGSTQITEILPIDGVKPVGMLPGAFALATIYTTGIPKTCKLRDAAETLCELLTGDFAKGLRPAAGFGI